ncbi:MAG: glycosyltransferase family 4 protein [Sphingomonadales bacterium]|nr:glycosyltransferase family 4 protein [Sphingomonadales bacterium]
MAVAHGCLATWWSATKLGEPLPESYRWHRQLTGEGLRSATRVVAPSRSYARHVARAYGLSKTPMAVYNGRRQLASGPAVGHDFAFTVGRLWDEAKRTSLLDQTAGLLPIPFHAAGPVTGPHGETVACDNLHTLGALDEASVGRWLSRRPVFVSAACFEPFGLAVLEAAAAGCPLVLSDIPTFRELWDGAAVFAEDDSPQAFAWAIDALIADPPFRRALGAAAAARAANYTVEAMGGAMQRVYAAALDLGLEGRAA